MDSKDNKTSVVISIISSETDTLECAIPVSGYSVWVSEIMLQQTRVEAVIPYYLKCKKTWKCIMVLYGSALDSLYIFSHFHIMLIGIMC